MFHGFSSAGIILENMDELERVFLNTISREGLFPRGSSVCAAVSGGADSVAMAHLLTRYSGKKGFQVRILHINHGLRPEADEDQEFVEDLARSLSLPFMAVTPDVGNGGSMESQWSAARHAVYASQQDLVAVAHNASDRAETLLLRMVEGAGLRGLGGMDYRGRGPVRRPLLDLSRRSIREWLAQGNIPWVEDSTNMDTGMARNRIRMNVLPVLEENFPEAVKGICRSGSILSAWRDLQDQITVMFPSHEIERKVFLSLPEVIACLVLWNISGRPRSGFEEFTKVFRWLHDGGKGEHILPGVKRLVAEDEELRVEERGSGRF